MDEALREKILQTIKAHFKQTGNAPGNADFSRLFDVKKTSVIPLLYKAGFRSVGDANETAIGVKNEKKFRDEEKLLRSLGTLTRRLQRYPAVSDIRVASMQDADFPSFSAISDWAKSETRVEKLRQFAESNTDFSDILPYVPQQFKSSDRIEHHLLTSANDSTIEEISYEISDDFVPPILVPLQLLAHPSQRIRETWNSQNRNVAVEFEKRVRAAFEIIGFEVEDLGQGRGRNPDGRAIDLSAHWAAVIDAKSREETYRLATDDRALREYYEQSDKMLRAKGVKNISIVIVSSSFEPKDLEPAKGLRKLSGASAVVLLEARALLRIVDGVLRMPIQKRLDFVEHLLSDTQIVDQRLVEKAS